MSQFKRIDSLIIVSLAVCGVLPAALLCTGVGAVLHIPVLFMSIGIRPEVEVALWIGVSYRFGTLCLILAVVFMVFWVRWIPVAVEKPWMVRALGFMRTPVGLSVLMLVAVSCAVMALGLLVFAWSLL